MILVRAEAVKNSKNAVVLIYKQYDKAIKTSKLYTYR